MTDHRLDRRLPPEAHPHLDLSGCGGGGFTANGDLLDYPLVAKKYTLEEAKKLRSER